MNTYRYHNQQNLSPIELFFLIAADETCSQAGIDDIEAVILILSGLPILPTRAKPLGATQGTSVASVMARSIFRYEFKRKVLPTVTLQSIKRLRFARKVGHRGTQKVICSTRRRRTIGGPSHSFPLGPLCRCRARPAIVPDATWPSPRPARIERRFAANVTLEYTAFDEPADNRAARGVTSSASVESGSRKYRREPRRARAPRPSAPA